MENAFKQNHLEMNDNYALQSFSSRSRGDNEGLWEKISLFIPPQIVNYTLMGLLSDN